MIKSFKNADAEELFRAHRASRRLAAYAKVALRKLDQLDVVNRIDELFVSLGNMFKKIRGDFWQIRVHGKHRIRFRWDGADAYDLEIYDFH